METLGEALPRQQVRVEEILRHYEDRGPEGLFAVIWMTDLLRRAQEAWHAQDAVAMLRLYPQLLEVQE